MRIIRQVSSFTALHLSACITALLYDVTGIIAITVKISAGAAGQPAAPVFYAFLNLFLYLGQAGDACEK